MNSNLDEPKNTAKKSYILERLNEIREFFIGSKESNYEHALKDDPYLEKLLAHAPRSFLESKTNQQLANLASDLNILIEDIKRTKCNYLCKVSSDGQGIFIVTLDRPFVVSSLSECCRALQIQLMAMLHPIIEVDDSVYSVSYLVLSHITEELLSSINQVMDLLILATDDHQSMVARIQDTAVDINSDSYQQKFAQAENQQTSTFLEWLIKDSFILTGVRLTKVEGYKLKPTEVNLGILKSNDPLVELINKEIEEDLSSFQNLEEPIWLTKFRESCPIHRKVRMSHVQVALCDDTGNLSSILSIIGIFSSKGIAEEGTNIPLIRKKLDYLLKESNVIKGSHDYKSIADTLGRMPKEEAIRLSREGLMSLVEQSIDVSSKLDPVISVRFDASKRGASVLVMLPPGRYSDQVKDDIARCIVNFFSVPLEDVESYVDSSSHTVTKLYYHIAFTYCPTENFNIQSLTDEIITVSEDFEQRFLKYLQDKNDLKDQAITLVKAFDLRYRASHTAKQATEHLSIFSTLKENKNIYVGISPVERRKGYDHLEIISKNKIFKLSDFLPVLESAGFTVHSDYSFLIEVTADEVYSIHQVVVEAKSGIKLNKESFNLYIKSTLEEILLGKSDFDVLTSLALNSNLTNRQITLLRGFCSYLWQLGAFTRKHLIREALADNPVSALKLWQYFDARFNPNFDDNRIDKQETLLSEYIESVRNEKDISKDRVLRSLLTLVQSILRTNYYQDYKEIAIKIDCSKIDFMPDPKPWREIFVHSYEVEGVHLRTGPVARGGLRWSERPDDFRTEVLGLVKTQKVKNVFIVPEGAKGGFIVRRLPTASSEIPGAVKNTYIKFIRALLSLADNKLPGKIIPPQNVIRYDQDDPYFVVAADKGTATFSDVANNIAVNEVGFWLDDAFASGGSNGYDHKIYGITARGGWECVLRHFNDLGIDYINDTITVVGIGDMAGDVFGNGMLLSENIKLIAAFNHQHIFLDPNPDPKKSFQERKRLFQKPGSKWSDYSPEVLSVGGQIVERSAKEISLSSQVCGALGTNSDSAVVSGETLVQLILKAPVDLLWNGGIGTYIKASTETHTQVNDSGNDRVRVNANQLRCKVIGEGGNLGLTQQARVEFSSLGGRVNTDAIDNSAGVGLSDKEVNLKLLFAGLMSNGKITREERNILLKEIANEVCQQVLTHNQAHAYRLTMSSQRSVAQHDFFLGFMSYMEQKGFINRTLDGLPQDNEIYRRLTLKSGLYRPELAVCMAASKMWIKDTFHKSDLTESKSLNQLLINYFPLTIRDKFTNEILNHPLRNSILATQVTNLIVDVLGISYFYRLIKGGSLNKDTALKACLCSLIILDAEKNIIELKTLDTTSTCSVYLSIRSKFEHQLRSLTNWLTMNINSNENFDDIVVKYKKLINTGLNANYFKETFNHKGEALPDILSDDLKYLLLTLPRVILSLELLSLSQERQIQVDQALIFMKKIKDVLGISGREYLKDSIQTKDRWERALTAQSIADIDKALVNMVHYALDNAISDPDILADKIKSSSSYESIIQSINELNNISPSVAHLAVIARQLSSFLLN